MVVEMTKKKKKEKMPCTYYMVIKYLDLLFNYINKNKVLVGSSRRDQIGKK